MDAPHGHEAIPVNSFFVPPTARVTLAVLVDCEREPQYFPNLDVAKLAASASTWRSHQVKVVDGDGQFNSTVTPERAARVTMPVHYEGTSPAVVAIFKLWGSFRKLKEFWRPNPSMPSGDVTPETSPRARPAALVDGARPYNTVDTFLPVNPAPVPAAPHVNKKEFPAMAPSPYVGVGGIKGTKDQPKATTQGVPAFTRPADGKVPPRAVPSGSKAATKPSSNVPSKSTIKAQKAAANLKGRDAGQPQVTFTRLTDQQVAEAQQTVRRSPRKHDPESKRGQVESMDITLQSDVKKDSEEPKKPWKDKGPRD